MKNVISDSEKCRSCANYLFDLTCLAFQTIPTEILTGEIEHDTPLPNQGNEIVFEPLDESK